MRIAVVTRFVHHVGGIESYLGSVLPALIEHGHEVEVWHEHATPDESTTAVAAAAAHWFGEEPEQRRRAVSGLVAWRPDLVFVHGLDDATLQALLPGDIPVVTILHAYDGTCVSGTKLLAFPTPKPCTRRLGPACLLNYYPRRCGGWHPGTMMTLYRHQRRRQELLLQSTAVVTLSEHMRREAIAQGIAPHTVTVLPQFVSMETTPRPDHGVDDERTGHHIGFAGRLEPTKGARMLLDALAQMSPAARAGLRVTIAGEGRERSHCEAEATRLRAMGVECTLTGWLSPDDRSALMKTLDLLVVPSIWPEPFGLVGLEAAAAGVPALAFDVGGIGEWLHNGVTGRLLAGPATARALAAGLDECLGDAARLRAWGDAARTHARLCTLERHVDALLDLFVRAARRASGSPSDLETAQV